MLRAKVVMKAFKGPRVKWETMYPVNTPVKPYRASTQNIIPRDPFSSRVASTNVTPADINNTHMKSNMP